MGKHFRLQNDFTDSVVSSILKTSELSGRRDIGGARSGVRKRHRPKIDPCCTDDDLRALYCNENEKYPENVDEVIEELVMLKLVLNPNHAVGFCLLL